MLRPSNVPAPSALAALILYGSRTRGDDTEASDVDLLAVARDGAPARLSGGRVSLSRYPLAHVLGRARAGDLFAFHVVSEGRVLFEDGPVFASIAGAFALRPDYAREIALASDVGWFLLHHGDPWLDPAWFNRRIAWCTHTMLVAAAATRRRAVFSAAGLAEFAGCEDVGAVIANKRSASASEDMVERFRGVLGRFGAGEPPALPTLGAELRRFQADENRAGVIAIRAMLRRSCARVPSR